MILQIPRSCQLNILFGLLLPLASAHAATYDCLASPATFRPVGAGTEIESPYSYSILKLDVSRSQTPSKAESDDPLHNQLIHNQVTPDLGETRLTVRPGGEGYAPTYTYTGMFGSYHTQEEDALLFEPEGQTQIKISMKKTLNMGMGWITLEYDSKPFSWTATSSEGDLYQERTITTSALVTYKWGAYSINWSVPSYPNPYVMRASVPVTCKLRPLQLVIDVTPELNFGQTTTGTTTFREMAIIINSGTQIPSGTYTMTSPDAKANGRINLGGGEVSMRGSPNVEYKMGQAIPVTSRDTRLEAVLDATGATPGPAADAHLTVTMTVN